MNDHYMCLGVMLVQDELSPRKSSQPRRQYSKRHEWTKEEDTFIKKHYLTKNREFIEKSLGLDWQVISNHARKSLGLLRGRKQEEIIKRK